MLGGGAGGSFRLRGRGVLRGARRVLEAAGVFGAGGWCTCRRGAGVGRGGGLVEVGGVLDARRFLPCGVRFLQGEVEGRAEVGGVRVGIRY